MTDPREQQIRDQIAALTRELYERRHRERPFIPGQTHVPYAGRVFDAEELVSAVDSALDFWLTLGPHGEAFERELAEYLGTRWSIIANSGSSANLLALSALTSPQLGARRLRPGDEVITTAGGFPTTVNPILQIGAVPVFVDNDPSTGNVRPDSLEQARTERTRAVVLAHTLGNPFDVDAVLAFCRRNDLFLVEDNCDALGSLWHGRKTGTFGDLSTQSFYPPHHITMGEGGAVNITRHSRLKVAVESFRDWGRDCWCASGKDNTCGKRFDWELGALPRGYDHKYIYSHLGYNLKPLDIQAAIGRIQLGKLPAFVAARVANHCALAAAVQPYAEVLAHQRALPEAQPAWFGFLMLVEPGAPFSRNDLALHLESRKVATRMLFGGNLTRQPAYTQLAADAAEAGRPAPFRVVDDLAGADRLMVDGLFVGTYPGIDPPRLAYIQEVLVGYLRDRTGIHP